MIVVAKDIIKVAELELGYHEKASNKNLDDKTANSGSANFQKYGRDLFAAGYYNGSKNGYAWCDQFVDWCFFTACGKDKKKAEYLECQTGDLGAGCKFSMEYYQKAGCFSKTPKIGDQIFFRYSGTTGADHTGLVIGITDKQVTTIEGNSNDQVRKKNYDLTYYAILGYGHPRYDKDTESKVTTESAKKESAKKVTVELYVLKVGSSGEQVKTLQRLLKQLGYRDQNGNLLSVDGDFGKRTEYVTKRFQSKKGLTEDGICGAKTWKSLLTGAKA